MLTSGSLAARTDIVKDCFEEGDEERKEEYGGSERQGRLV